MPPAVDIPVGVFQSAAQAGICPVSQADAVAMGQVRGEHHPHRHRRRVGGIQVIFQIHGGKVVGAEQRAPQPGQVGRGEGVTRLDRGDRMEEVVIDEIGLVADGAKLIARPGD